MNEKTGLRDKLSLLWKALLLSFRMKSKVSICISVIGMLLGLFTLWINILNADLINRITGLIQGEDVLRQALFTLLCIVLIEVLLLVYNMLKSYFVQYDSMRADEYIHDTTYDILSRTKYENIENNSNFMQKLDFINNQGWWRIAQLTVFVQNIVSAVISLAGIVYARSVRVGGDKMDEAIMTHVKRKYNMLIGEASAEEIKIKIASAYPMDPEQQIEVKGRDLVTGIPQNIIITSEEVRKAISEQVESIVQAVRIALEQTPPELAADIVDRGIVLTGGGALLKGLDQLLREQTSLPITVVDDPLSTVVMGTGRALDNIHVLKDVCID